MERERVLIHLDISALHVRDQDASGTPEKGESLVSLVVGIIYLPLCRQLEFFHRIQIIGAAGSRQARDGRGRRASVGRSRWG